MQYKSKKVFGFWQKLAKDSQKTIIIYYGVAGHGKGLVNAPSGFGVKDPIRKAIILEDWYFNSSVDMVRFLSERNGNDIRKSTSTFQLKISNSCAQVMISKKER